LFALTRGRANLNAERNLEVTTSSRRCGRSHQTLAFWRSGGGAWPLHTHTLQQTTLGPVVRRRCSGASHIAKGANQQM